MNKVLILSDSHGLQEEISEITTRHQIKDIIHCGDSELEADDPVLNGIKNVRGNCDFDGKFPNSQLLEIGGLSFFVTHGHLHDVNISLLTLSYEAEQYGAQVICYGHTHVARAEKVDDKLFINPGSIRLPRRRQEKTYAIMTWEHMEEVYVDFYTTTGKHVTDLSYITSLKS